MSNELTEFIKSQSVGTKMAGEFTLSTEHAIAKLRERGLARPTDFPLLVVAAAVASGALSLTCEREKDTLEFRFMGSFPTGFMEQPYRLLLAKEDSPGVRNMGYALLAASILKPRAASLRCGELVLKLNGDDWESGPAESSQTVFRIEGLEQDVLLQTLVPLVQFAPLELTWEGQKLEPCLLVDEPWATRQFSRQNSGFRVRVPNAPRHETLHELDFEGVLTLAEEAEALAFGLNLVVDGVCIQVDPSPLESSLVCGVISASHLRKDLSMQDVVRDHEFEMLMSALAEQTRALTREMLRNIETAFTLKQRAVYLLSTLTHPEDRAAAKEWLDSQKAVPKSLNRISTALGGEEQGSPRGLRLMQELISHFKRDLAAHRWARAQQAADLIARFQSNFPVKGFEADQIRVLLHMLRGVSPPDEFEVTEDPELLYCHGLALRASGHQRRGLLRHRGVVTAGLGSQDLLARARALWACGELEPAIEVLSGASVPLEYALELADMIDLADSSAERRRRSMELRLGVPLPTNNDLLRYLRLEERRRSGRGLVSFLESVKLQVQIGFASTRFKLSSIQGRLEASLEGPVSELLKTTQEQPLYLGDYPQDWIRRATHRLRKAGMGQEADRVLARWSAAAHLTTLARKCECCR